MSQNKIDEQRHSVLKTMEERFNESFIPARLVEPLYENESESDSEPPLRPEILNVLMENLVSDKADCVCEFFFIPSHPEDEVWMFDSIITVDEPIEDDIVPDLFESINIVNAIVPVGAFLVDLSKKNIAYRYAYAMKAGASDEELTDAVDLCMGNAVETVQRYGYILQEVATGQRSVESILGLIG